MLAATATVTEVMIVEVLEMTGCAVVSVSPNKPNIFYSVKARSSSIGDDLAFITSDLLCNNVKANRVIVYCQSLDMCAPGSEQVSDNRLYGMYHAKTDEYNVPTLRPRRISWWSCHSFR